MHGTHWWLQRAKSTLFMFGWQRALSSAWHRQCAVVFGTSLHPSCPPDIHSPQPYWASVASCVSVCMYAFACVWNFACTRCAHVCIFFELQLGYFLPCISHERDRQQQSLVSIFHTLLYLYFFRKDYQLL